MASTKDEFPLIRTPGATLPLALCLYRPKPDGLEPSYAPPPVKKA